MAHTAAARTARGGVTVIHSYRFIDEFSAKNMLHVKIIRADIPRGNISSIETTEVPDNIIVFDSDDIEGSNRVSVLQEEMPLLCDGTINYEGEPILLIASEDPQLLEIAERRLKISYETDFSLLAFDPASEDQVVDSAGLSRGNPSKEFEETTQIVEAEYRTTIESHVSRAPIGAYAENNDGRMSIYTPTHWPFHVRATVAEVTGIPETEIKVIQTNPSPAYGEKVVYPSVLAAMAALISYRSSKPARILLSPAEVEKYTTRKAPVHVKSTSILNEAGKIIAHDTHMRFDVGAYPLFTKELLQRAVITSGSYYEVPNVSITAEAIRTTSPPMNLYRGLGVSQSLFATEVHFSRLAEFSQLNPGDWKRDHSKSKNIITGSHISHMPLEKLIDTVINQSDFYRKHSAYEQIRKRRNSVKASRRFLRGIGIATGFTGNGFTDKPNSGDNWGIKATLDKKDQLVIECGTMTVPEAIKTIWKRRAGEILGISPESVEIASGDTDTLPDSGPMMLGMPVTVYTSLVDRCCNYIRKQRFNKPLPIEVRRNIIAARRSTWDTSSFTGIPFHNFSWGAVVTEVQLDPLTLVPEVRGIWAAFDCGLVYDTQYAVSIAEGSIYEALAWAMGEQKVTPRYYQDYVIEGHDIPNLRLPPVSVVFANRAKGLPGGINEIAESLVPAAFVTALSQATGVYFDRIPLTSEIIQSYLEEPS